jgi:hypothetical protein
VNLAAVSVQAGVLESCGLCPADCPMHVEHDRSHRVDSDTVAKPRCHGGGDLNHQGEESQLRRPPCKTSFTLAGSLLPPFVLAVGTLAAVGLPPLATVPDACESPSDRRQAPETPPPILLV